MCTTDDEVSTLQNMFCKIKDVAFFKINTLKIFL